MPYQFVNLPGQDKTIISDSGGGHNYGHGGGAFIGAALGSVFSRLFRGGWDGDGRGHCDEVALLRGQSDIRRDIPEQTIDLQQTMFEGMLANAQASAAQTADFNNRFFAAQLAACEQNGETQREIGRLGFDNALLTVKSQAETAREIAALAARTDACCCETKLEIERSAHNTQLRDLGYKGDTDRQLAEIKCQIRESELRAENKMLLNELEEARRCGQTKQLMDCISKSAFKAGAALNAIGTNQKIDNAAVIWPPLDINWGCC